MSVSTDGLHSPRRLRYCCLLVTHVHLLLRPFTCKNVPVLAPLKGCFSLQIISFGVLDPGHELPHHQVSNCLWSFFKKKCEKFRVEPFTPVYLLAFDSFLTEQNVRLLLVSK